MRVVAVILAAGLAACVNTREIPIAQNVVRIQSDGRGLIAASRIDDVTLRRAAEATLARGYTHFRLDGVDTQSGSDVSGFVVGQSLGSFTPVSAVRTRTASTGVTVVMFSEGDAGARSALDARAILAEAT